MLPSGQQWLFLEKSILKRSFMQSVLRLTVPLHHVLQILGNFVFGMPLTA